MSKGFQAQLSHDKVAVLLDQATVELGMMKVALDDLIVATKAAQEKHARNDLTPEDIVDLLDRLSRIG